MLHLATIANAKDSPIFPYCRLVDITYESLYNKSRILLEDIIMTLLTASLPDITSGSLSLLDICLRFLCAMVIGLAVGIEREYTHRPAGMRTHILVALGSCAAMVVGQLIYNQYGGNSDPARLSAQVISGVGFLGAGTIMREGANVKGLTTAASLWAVAGLGIAAGGGYYTVALVGTVLIIITLTIFELLQNVLVSPNNGSNEYCVETKDFAAALKAINALADQCHCEIRNISAENCENGLCRIRFTAAFGRGKQNRRRVKFFEGIAVHPAICSVRSSDEPVASK